MLRVQVIVLWLVQLCFLTILVQCNKFDPYEANGGLVCAVAGSNYCLIATDTRLSGPGYKIHSRNHILHRLWSVDDNIQETILQPLDKELRAREYNTTGWTVSSSSSIPQRLPWSTRTTTHLGRVPPVWVGSVGCATDCQALQQDLQHQLRLAQRLGNVPLHVSTVAMGLSQQLYTRRKFPYYTFCVVAGLEPAGDTSCAPEKERRGQVYVYDAIGSMESVAVAATGTGKECLQPILDRWFTCHRDSIIPTTSATSNNNNPVRMDTLPLARPYVQESAQEAIDKVCQAYRKVSERDIHVGDQLVLCLMQPSKQDQSKVECQIHVVPLMAD
eukprot:Nitzschia sp. Nitz4//scaffold39_size137210//127703//128692//NITZ4_003221-RA/size137210-processed-gene-0.48-mRNA-1//1//CDS//3329550449//346//frame0